MKAPEEFVMRREQHAFSLPTIAIVDDVTGPDIRANEHDFDLLSRLEIASFSCVHARSIRVVYIDTWDGKPRSLRIRGKEAGRAGG